MARNHKQVIDTYRNISIELESLGLRQFVLDSYFHMKIAEQTGYSLVSVRKIIDKYEKSKDHTCFETFLKTIPNVYSKIRKSLIHYMITDNINEH